MSADLAAPTPRSGPTLDARLSELGISLQLTRLSTGTYQAIDGSRYDGITSQVGTGATAHAAVERLIEITRARSTECPMCGERVYSRWPDAYGRIAALQHHYERVHRQIGSK